MRKILLLQLQNRETGAYNDTSSGGFLQQYEEFTARKIDPDAPHEKDWPVQEAERGGKYVGH